MLSANAPFLPHAQRHKHWPAKLRRKHKKGDRRRVRFTDVSARRHSYDFDWDLERAYWYSRDELKSMSLVRLEDAAVLREARGVEVATRDDADDLTDRSRDVFVGYKITNALDDRDDDPETSVQGIEPFVFPVLQKEMLRRKRELQATVLRHSRDSTWRKLDPQGTKLAKESARLSKWAGDVASERGVKYCEVKRGGGGLLQATKPVKAKRGFSICEKMDEERARASLLGAINNDVMLEAAGYAEG